MLARIQIRRDTETNWNTTNPVLYDGEIGFETIPNTKSGRFKIGDGSTEWINLPYQLGQWNGETDGDIRFGYEPGEGNVKIKNNLQVDGNLFVKGTTTTVNSQEVTFNDRMLTLNWSEDPVKHYDETIISGIEVNIGYNDVISTIPILTGDSDEYTTIYDSSKNETSIHLSGDIIDNWPATYRQNYVIYFSDDDPFTDPDFAFFIKDYDSTSLDENGTPQNKLIVIGDASQVPDTMGFEIHNVIRQLYWNNNPNHSGWHVDNDFYANNGIVLGDTTNDIVGTIKFDQSSGDFKGRFEDGNGVKYWKSLSSSTYVGSELPNNPSNSDLWWDSSDGTFRIYYTDENSSQWVTISSGGGTGGGDGVNYGNSNVDSHLNKNGASPGQVLSWSGTDYAWIDQSSGGAGINLSDLSVGSPNSASGSGSISYDDTLGIFTYTPPDLSDYVLSSNLNYYSNSDVDAHLNKNSAANNQILSWSGTDYVWIPQPSGGQSQPSITWALDGNGFDYVFSGPGIETGNTNDPELFLVRGQTYNFDNQSAGGGHPFKLKTSLPEAGQPASPNYTSGVSESGTITTFTVPMDAPDTLYYICTSHPTMSGTINIIPANSGGGTSLQSRTTINTSAMTITDGSSTISANSSASGYITGYKAYSLFKVSINDPDLWVTIYTDNTSMTNDSTRLYTEDPPPGSGVIAEFISSTSNQDIIVSPTTIGFNMDSTVSDKIYLKVQNIGSSDSTFSVELTILQLEQ